MLRYVNLNREGAQKKESCAQLWCHASLISKALTRWLAGSIVRHFILEGECASHGRLPTACLFVIVKSTSHHKDPVISEYSVRT